jgi:hypothetical protein
MHRPHSVGCERSAPTSLRQCQQRSHFVSFDGVTVTCSAPPSPASCSSHRGRDRDELQVVAEIASSAVSSAFAAIARFACSDEPTCPRAHFLDRLVRDLADRAQAFPFREQRRIARLQRPEGLGEDRDRRPGANTCHASSAVKLRKGAIQRSIAWVMCQSAVCAERRAKDLGAVVYRRSFSTSR